MSDGDVDIAPPPHETLTLHRAPVAGWFIVFDGELVACFGTIGEATQWMDRVLGPADGPRRDDPLPAVLLDEIEKPKLSMWSLIRGGKSP